MQRTLVRSPIALCPFVLGLFPLPCVPFAAGAERAYRRHPPIAIENLPTSPERPLVIEGLEISNPSGPGIQVRDVDHVVIRDNLVHGCGAEISLERARRVREAGDARKAALDAPFETGGILVFDARGEVEVSGNEVRDNDYGILVMGHRHRARFVSVRKNVVERNHRSAFISVGQADGVEICDNVVRDNGLDVFYDNEGLVRAMRQGLAFGDGRSQGILAKDSNRVRIFRNLVVNSVSDGIGIMNRGLASDPEGRLLFVPENERQLVSDIEIFDNRVERNGEQGIWITSARRGLVFRNEVVANAHRRARTGGSSGIFLEGDVTEFEVYENEIAWNDIFGIAIAGSSGNAFRANRIHHNGGGGIGWLDVPSVSGRSSRDNVIEGNEIRHNRVAAFVVQTAAVGRTIVRGNRIEANGGSPIHFEFYADYDVRRHPADWVYDGEPVTFQLLSDDLRERFDFDRDSAARPGGATPLLVLAACLATAAGLVSWKFRRRGRRNS